jgi:hypothetical protein
MQLTELCDHVTRRNWDIAGEFVDSGWRGAAASRPELTVSWLVPVRGNSISPKKTLVLAEIPA